MVEVKWKVLFPNKVSVLVFIFYIVLFVNQGILVTASQSLDNNYNYDIAAVVLLTEALKLWICTLLYCKDNSISNLFHAVLKSRKVMGLYFIPAFLYCLYNNLSFIDLAVFDPTTYYLMLQLRVVVTAVLFQLIFRKKLTTLQWISLLLLTCGCMLKQVNLFNWETGSRNEHKKSFHLNFDLYTIYILVQVFCSCLAGVYNEYLLKEPGATVDIYIQNIFMYLNSIVCNSLLLLIEGNILNVFTWESLKIIFEYKVVLVMVNNAAIGIITSFFLKNLNSILKTFASALELILTAVFCYILFGIPIYVNTVLSILVVMVAIVLYSQNPVLNVARKNDKEDELLMEKV
ncbi:UDP-galactose transporter senju [Agrilus planipennis]|uniref:UDP-galactose transporter senju n=1 Tax=Agrilus planipennis TaxID=224129 RepID=A0A1W4XNJ7_AGRPL|nr:UDP-galactose transporter senju [Agrilus planipennis]